MTAGAWTDAAWYTARGAGVVCLLLLTVVVGLGIATRSGRPLPGLPRFAVAAVHRNAALLAVTLLGLHVGLLVLDPYAQLRLVDVVLPFTAAYRPLWVGLGTLTLDLLVAVVVTSLLRHRLGVVAWRLVHWSAYAIWPLALLHGLRSGTDAGEGWFLALSLLCAAAVAALLVWRASVTFTEYGEFRVLPGRTDPSGYPARLLPAPARPVSASGTARRSAAGRPGGRDRGGVPR
jgi:methionine sulfoxide reductase heme-binding subunit